MKLVTALFVLALPLAGICQTGSKAQQVPARQKNSADLAQEALTALEAFDMAVDNCLADIQIAYLCAQGTDRQLRDFETKYQRFMNYPTTLALETKLKSQLRQLVKQELPFIKKKRQIIINETRSAYECMAYGTAYCIAGIVTR